VEAELEPDAGEGVVREEIAIEGVEHDRRVDAAERARLEELDLAASALFGGRAEEIDGADDLLCSGLPGLRWSSRSSCPSRSRPWRARRRRSTRNFRRMCATSSASSPPKSADFGCLKLVEANKLPDGDQQRWQ